MHFYGWKSGLKTGMYYLRSRPAVDSIKFTVDLEGLVQAGVKNDILKAMNQGSIVKGEDGKTRIKVKKSGGGGGGGIARTAKEAGIVSENKDPNNLK